MLDYKREVNMKNKGFNPLEITACALSYAMRNKKDKTCHTNTTNDLRKRQRRFLSLTGFTLIEVLVAITIVVVAIGALALLYPGILAGLRQDTQNLRTWEIAKQEIETLKQTNFATLYADSYEPGTTPATKVFSTGAANASGAYYIERVRNNAGATLNDLLKIEVVVCYQSGNRIVGEDLNLNGVLDVGEDTNADQKISSSVSLITLVSQ
jgi:prepilin-type N-terminal cleavage/methylation domain-containing protein